MTVADNLRMYGYSLGKDRKAIEAGMEEAYAVFPRLSDRRNQLASTLSGGEQQMLGLSKALIIAPRILLIDEFSLGLAPVIVGQLMETVRRLNERGTAVLLVEQSVNVALSLVDRVYFMEKGRITYQGRAEDLRADPQLVAALSMGGAHVEELVAFESPEAHAAPAGHTNGHLPAPVAAAVVAHAVADAHVAPAQVPAQPRSPESPAYAAPVAEVAAAADPGADDAPEPVAPVVPEAPAHVAEPVAESPTYAASPVPDVPSYAAPAPSTTYAPEPTPLEPTSLEPVLAPEPTPLESTPLAPAMPAAAVAAEAPAQEGTA
jgi:hypothetical protein